MILKETIEQYKEKLEKEKIHLVKDLERVGKRNPNVPGDWEMTPVDLNVETSDPNELADTFEEMETRSALENKAEERLSLVEQALSRIKRGTFGYCHVCKKEIEEKRLKVNLVAKTCIKHAKG